jgi:hypothetical protein
VARPAPNGCVYGLCRKVPPRGALLGELDELVDDGGGAHARYGDGPLHPPSAQHGRDGRPAAAAASMTRTTPTWRDPSPSPADVARRSRGAVRECWISTNASSPWDPIVGWPDTSFSSQQKRIAVSGGTARYAESDSWLRARGRAEWHWNSRWLRLLRGTFPAGIPSAATLLAPVPQERSPARHHEE